MGNEHVHGNGVLHAIEIDHIRRDFDYRQHHSMFRDVVSLKKSAILGGMHRYVF